MALIHHLIKSKNYQVLKKGDFYVYNFWNYYKKN